MFHIKSHWYTRLLLDCVQYLICILIKGGLVRTKRTTPRSAPVDADRTTSAYHGIEVPASSRASVHIDMHVRPVSFPTGLKIVPKVPIAPRSDSSVARRCSRVPKLQSTLVPDLLLNRVFHTYQPSRFSRDCSAF